jgi:hypothetical protein
MLTHAATIIVIITLHDQVIEAAVSTWTISTPAFRWSR